MQPLRNLSISAKILASNLFMLALLIIIAGTSWYSSAILSNRYQAMEQHLNALVYLAKAETALWELRWGLAQYMLTTPEEQAKIKADEAKWYAQINETMGDYATLRLTSDEQAALRAWQASWPRYRDARPRWFELYDAGLREEAATWRANTTTKFGRESVAALGQMIQLAREQASLGYAEALATQRLSRGIELGAGLIVLFGGLWLAVALARAISRPVREITAVARAVAAGDLGRTASVSSRDEVGELAATFNQMTANLRRQMEEQRQANEELRAAAATRVAKDELETAVQHYSTFAVEVAGGNLTARLPVDDTDSDLGRLGRSLNQMVLSLHSLTRQVSGATSAISGAAAQILTATTQLASSAAEQSSTVTATSSTLHDVKQIADQTAVQAAQVASDSQEALSTARHGSETVEETIGQMRQIQERVEGIAQTIASLAEQTQAIGAITATVAELADQSNLLALNAAIEAARAGEQGKSFAVVAQHVRGLAERSKAATMQVRELLSQIERATGIAVQVSVEGTRGVSAGLRRAGEAGEAIHQIADEIAQGAQANAQMAERARLASSGIAQINTTISAIQRTAVESLASTRQAESAARDLNELARSLQRAVAAFRL